MGSRACGFVELKTELILDSKNSRWMKLLTLVIGRVCGSAKGRRQGNYLELELRELRERLGGFPFALPSSFVDIP